MFNLNRIGILLLLLVVVGTAAGVSCGETPDEAVVAVNTGPTPTRRPPATRRPTCTISPSTRCGQPWTRSWARATVRSPGGGSAR